MGWWRRRFRGVKEDFTDSAEIKSDYTIISIEKDKGGG